MEDCIENVDARKDDLISELPDALLHQILSFVVDMRCVVQTSILGKRWRYLWKKMSVYNRSMAAVGEGEQKPDYKKFTDFLKRILRLLNGSNLRIFSIQAFRLSCDEDYIKEHESARWYDNSGHRSLEISESRAFDLSRWFYHTFPCLKVLHLKSVFLEGTDHFITSCPVLESLVILDCVVMQTDKLNVSAPRLKNLELGNLSTNKAPFSLFQVQDAVYLKVTVSAPNLTSFKCTDLVSVEYSLLNISSVVEADIDVEFRTGFFLSGTNEKEAKIVIECLAGLCNVRSLRLSAWWLEAVYEVYKARMECLVTTFCNLRLLKLKTSLSTSEYRAITYLFDTCPNVETLVLEMTKPSQRGLTASDLTEMFMVYPDEEKSMEKDECLEAYLASECNFSFHHLKFVKIGNATGSQNELEFLKFLLKNATILDTITVYFSKTGLLNHEMRRRFSEDNILWIHFSWRRHINPLVLSFMFLKKIENVLSKVEKMITCVWKD